jgi:hypothetical protein
MASWFGAPVFTTGFYWGMCHWCSCRSLVLCVCFVDCFLSFYFYFWPLCCLSFIDLRILFAPLVSSNSSCTSVSIGEYFTLTFGFVINEIWLCYALKWLVICWHPTLIPLYVLNTGPIRLMHVQLVFAASKLSMQLRSRSKTGNQDKKYKWIAMYTCRLLFQCASTM